MGNNIGGLPQAPINTVDGAQNAQTSSGPQKASLASILNDIGKFFSTIGDNINAWAQQNFGGASTVTLAHTTLAAQDHAKAEFSAADKEIALTTCYPDRVAELVDQGKLNRADLRNAVSASLERCGKIDNKADGALGGLMSLVKRHPPDKEAVAILNDLLGHMTNLPTTSAAIRGWLSH